MKPTVLVIDDSRVSRMFISAELEAEFNVVEASCVESGLRALASPGAASPSAVVVDRYLPDGNGLELLTEVQRRAPWCGRVLVSSQLPPGCDADTVLPRPWQPGAALAAVRHALALECGLRRR